MTKRNLSLIIHAFTQFTIALSGGIGAAMTTGPLTTPAIALAVLFAAGAAGKSVQDRLSTLPGK